MRFELVTRSRLGQNFQFGGIFSEVRAKDPIRGSFLGVKTLFIRRSLGEVGTVHKNSKRDQRLSTVPAKIALHNHLKHNHFYPHERLQSRMCLILYLLPQAI